MVLIKNVKNSNKFNLFLMDGKVIGRINCTLANWTGLAFKVHRTHLYKCKENGEIVDDTLKKTGYLIGLLMLQVLYWGCILIT
ncbi:hypothetical protein HMPREF0078_0551 [Anaerococcus vaginalis ATCC 51170]|uniref:Uncharacterized protein n=1 Tax=Anaerococcus vaginalis ATCC 51170 TaxID=655811 RepID=C7HTF0_9FIRM|nr:hypothetical protein HMPREF0078_0551 [Anaerococcus vaginalis ATCC 51170]